MALVAEPSAEAEPALRRRGAKGADETAETQERADGWAKEEPAGSWADSKRECMAKLPSGLEYRIIRMASADSSEMPGPSTPCRCHYRGRLAADGTEFDCTYSTGSIVLKPEQAVKGWSEALQMMRKGDRWEVYIPRELAYGETGFGSVPPNADLIVELELTEVDAQEAKGQEHEFRISAKVFCATVIGLIFVIYHHFGVVAKNNAKEASLKVRGSRVPLHLVSGLASNPHVYFDLDVNGMQAGRVEFELFSTVVPRTAENFRALVTGEKGNSHKTGAKMHYKGSKIHHIVPSLLLQGGDFENHDGAGGESIYGGLFEDEWKLGIVQHSVPGLLTMANHGHADSNGAQFLVTLTATPWFDDHHVVFGRVLHGMDVLKHLEAHGSKTGRPTAEVVIRECGEIFHEGILQKMADAL